VPGARKLKVLSPPENTLRCGFCGKRQHDVEKLISGPTVFICNECVELCIDILRRERLAREQSEGGPSASPAERKAGAPGSRRDPAGRTWTPYPPFQRPADG
jgi:hypothetical protein